MKRHGTLVVGDSRAFTAADVIAREFGASADVEYDEANGHADDSKNEERDCTRVHVLDESFCQYSVDGHNETSGTWCTYHKFF